MGGGSNRQTSTGTTSPNYPPELSGAYRAFGDLATNVFEGFGPDLINYMRDQTPQQVAGPTQLMEDAYRQQTGLLNSQGPQAWSDALGMFGRLGNLPQWQGIDVGGLPQWQGADFSGIPGWSSWGGGQQGGGQQGGGYQSAMMKQAYAGDGSGQYEPGGFSGSPVSGSSKPQDDARAAGMGLDPSQAGGSAANYGYGFEPGGASSPPWTQANPNSGSIGQYSGAGNINQWQQSGARPTGDYGLDKWAKGSSSGSGGGGGGGGNLKDVKLPEWVENPLQNIDFANHPALQSALKTFAATTLPGIENAMIGAGLGRSGAAGNAIATGKAQMALPVMQQLMDLEMQNKGLDTGQRATDIGAQVTSRGQDASLAAARAAAAASRFGSSSALQAALAGQETARRGQDIQALLENAGMGLTARGQDMNALLQNAAMGLEARGMDVNSMLAAAQGLTGLGQADVNRITGNIGTAWDMGSGMRDLNQAVFDSEFNAAERPWERMMQFMGPLMGQMAQPGQTTRTVTTGGGK